jgi:hypothetical protein
MIKLEPSEEGGIVPEVPIRLQVGTFGDCEEGGSLRSHVMICEQNLRGGRCMAKPGASVWGTRSGEEGTGYH